MLPIPRYKGMDSPIKIMSPASSGLSPLISFGFKDVRYGSVWLNVSLQPSAYKAGPSLHWATVPPWRQQQKPKWIKPAWRSDIVSSILVDPLKIEAGLKHMLACAGKMDLHLVGNSHINTTPSFLTAYSWCTSGTETRFQGQRLVQIKSWWCFSKENLSDFFIVENVLVNSLVIIEVKNSWDLLVMKHMFSPPPFYAIKQRHNSCFWDHLFQKNRVMISSNFPQTMARPRSQLKAPFKWSKMIKIQANVCIWTPFL